MALENFTCVLLIEDDPDHVELIRRAFEDHAQVQLVTAGSLSEARACLSAFTPNLIIADWRLPDGESLDLLNGRSGTQSPPVVIMTSFGNERIAVNAISSGALDYVVKSSETLLDMPHVAEQAIHRWNILNEQDRMRQSLQKSEAEYRLLAENSTDVITRISPHGVLLYVSPACRKLLGYTPEELAGLPLSDFAHPEEISGLKNFLDLQSWAGKTVTYSLRFRHKNGEYVWLEATASIVLDEYTGQPTEIQASARDITERKQAQQNLHRAHADLQDAYEKTIEGWVRALDLRDHETEGHTQRVTELAVKLAKALGFSAEEIIHIRRGALLHDLGKIGVSDTILNKRGPLDEEEWAVMRQHPNLARDMLAPIAYLSRAIVIPYYHHEHWDGSGYPQGLAGEQIPLEARLFSIVDVWDALSHDRPYRRKLPRAEVLAYLRKQAGRLFDPRIVATFMQVLKEER